MCLGYADIEYLCMHQWHKFNHVSLLYHLKIWKVPTTQSFSKEDKVSRMYTFLLIVPDWSLVTKYYLPMILKL